MAGHWAHLRSPHVTKPQPEGRAAHGRCADSQVLPPRRARAPVQGSVSVQECGDQGHWLQRRPCPRRTHAKSPRRPKRPSHSHADHSAEWESGEGDSRWWRSRLPHVRWPWSLRQVSPERGPGTPTKVQGKEQASGTARSTQNWQERPPHAYAA